MPSSHIFAVMKNITHNTPCFVVSPSVKEATRNLVLANPTLDTCTAVDVLLEVDVVSTVTGHVVPLGSGLPTAVGTKFGFVTMGSAPTSLFCSLSYDCSLMLIPPDAGPAHQLHA